MLRNKSEIRISKEAPRTETNSETNKSHYGGRTFLSANDSGLENPLSKGSLFGILPILVI